MRKIRTQFELSKRGQSVDRRYLIIVGDGIHSTAYTLGPKDQFSDPKWSMFLGESYLSVEWSSSTDEGMYIDIQRQYVNPDFDFSPEAMQRREWLLAEPTVSDFRLYNPWIGKPFLSWGGHGRWSDDVDFSEGDSHDFLWSFSDWETKISEKNIKYSIQRLDDSDNFKEFKVILD